VSGSRSHTKVRSKRLYSFAPKPPLWQLLLAWMLGSRLMATMIDDLITRLEKASGPDRGLDRDIHREVAKRPINDETFVYGPKDGTRELTFAYPFFWSLWGCPRYTGSCDDAMSLIERGLEKEMGDLYGVAIARVGLNFHNGPFCGEHQGGSIPLALCIAALKSRQCIVRTEPELKQ
jgi:hypothetical protein